MQQLFLCLIFFFLTLSLHAQTVNRTVLQDLLDLPAPPATLAEQELRNIRPPFTIKRIRRPTTHRLKIYLLTGQCKTP